MDVIPFGPLALLAVHRRTQSLDRASFPDRPTLVSLDIPPGRRIYACFTPPRYIG